MSLGTYSTSIVTTNNQAFGWGRNKFGQLGDGTKHDALRPIRLRVAGGVDAEGNAVEVQSILSIASGKFVESGCDIRAALAVEMLSLSCAN